MKERAVIINATDENNREEVASIAQEFGAEITVSGDNIYILANGQRELLFRKLKLSESIKRSPYGAII